MFRVAKRVPPAEGEAMKLRILKRLFVIGVCGGTLLTVNAEKVPLEQLPQKLQDQIRTHTGGNRIEDIDRQTKNGQTTYEVAFKRDGEHTELRFNEQGQLVDRSGASALTSGKIEYKELPPAVQQMVDTRVKKGDINDIDRQVKGGEVTYEVGFKDNGEQKEILLSQDGRILRDVSVGNAPGVVGGRATVVPMLSRNPVKLADARKVEMDQLPAEARTVIMAQTAGTRIEDLEVGAWNGRPVYQAAFKSAGEHVELQVAANGQIVHDPRKTSAAAPVRAPVAEPTGRAAALGRPGGPFSGRSAADLPVNTLVPLSTPLTIDEDNVPPAVEQALNQHAPDAPVEEIQRGVWKDRLVYQFNFEDNGEMHHLQLDQTGKLVHDTRYPNRR